MGYYGVNFDLGMFLEIEADSEEEAIEEAKERTVHALEGEYHGFEAEKIEYLAGKGKNHWSFSKQLTNKITKETTKTEEELKQQLEEEYQKLNEINRGKRPEDERQQICNNIAKLYTKIREPGK